MKNKPVKIKRYSKSMGKKHAGSGKVKKTIIAFICITLLLGVGYFTAPFFIKALESAFTKLPPRPDSEAVIPPQLPTNSENTETESDTPQGEPETPTQVSMYCEILVSELLTPQAISQKAIELKEKGVTTAVLTLKNEKGEIFYDTQNDIGKNAVAKTIVDLKLVTQTFKEQGITTAANIYTFIDATTPNIKRETAVKYLGTEYNWLDTAKELGGKPWANPASSVMQTYIYDLTKEIIAAGVKETIYSGVHLPTGNSLDKREFGATLEQLQAHIKSFVNTLQTTTNADGAKASFVFEIEALTGENYTKYIIAPQNFGAENIIIKTTKSQTEKADISQIANKLKLAQEVSRVVVWQTDGNLPTVPTHIQGYFVK